MSEQQLAGWSVQRQLIAQWYHTLLRKHKHRQRSGGQQRANNYTAKISLCQLVHYTNTFEIGQAFDTCKVSPVQLILLGNAVITVIVDGHARVLCQA